MVWRIRDILFLQGMCEDWSVIQAWMREDAEVMYVGPARFRATPARIDLALRFAKRSIFQALWHTWTPADEEYLQRVVLPVIRADSWRCTTDITTYIFSVYRRVASNRTEPHQWTAAYTRAYNRGLGF